MSNIKDNIYWRAIGQILSFLNKLLHEDLGLTPDITLITHAISTFSVSEKVACSVERPFLNPLCSVASTLLAC